MWVGIALVTVAPMLLYLHRNANQSVIPRNAGLPKVSSDLVSPPRSKLVEGYLFGAINAVIFGFTPLMVRQGLIDSDGLGVLGAFVAYSGAALVLIPTLLFPGVRRALAGIDRSSGRWFVSATTAVLMAQMFHFLALSVAPVSLVMPIQRAGSVFLLPMSYLINRQAESFEPRILFAIAVSITGSLIIVL